MPCVAEQTEEAGRGYRGVMGRGEEYWLLMAMELLYRCQALLTTPDSSLVMSSTGGGPPGRASLPFPHGLSECLPSTLLVSLFVLNELSICPRLV